MTRVSYGGYELPTSNPLRKYWYGLPVVYRCYDATGRLIYIGCSYDVVNRFDQHRRSTWWASLIAKVHITIHATHLAAFEAEKRAIKTENPAFNLAHTDHWRGEAWTDADHLVFREWRARKKSAAA